MAKTKPKLNLRDSRTLKRLNELADNVVSAAQRGRDPAVDMPARTLSNTRYNKSKRILEMGGNTNCRQLFNLSQAKAYMQTMLVAKGVNQLIEQGKTSSLRSLFYNLKQDVKGTKEPTFENQDECDPIVEDMEVLLDSLREELHLAAEVKGNMVGNLVARR